MLESMALDRQIGEVEKDLNVLEKKTHELSLSIENRGGAEADDFATRMGERKALLDQKDRAPGKARRIKRPTADGLGQGNGGRGHRPCRQGRRFLPSGGRRN